MKARLQSTARPGLSAFRDDNPESTLEGLGTSAEGGHGRGGVDPAVGVTASNHRKPGRSQPRTPAKTLAIFAGWQVPGPAPVSEMMIGSSVSSRTAAMVGPNAMQNCDVHNAAPVQRAVPIMQARRPVALAVRISSAQASAAAMPSVLPRVDGTAALITGPTADRPPGEVWFRLAWRRLTRIVARTLKAIAEGLQIANAENSRSTPEPRSQGATVVLMATFGYPLGKQHHLSGSCTS